jgi:hypothetical protein
VILQVDPAALAETTRPLRDAAEVGRQVEVAGGELAGYVSHCGSEQVRRSTEEFLRAWSVGLRGVSDRGEALATALDTAAAGYGEAEDRLRRQHAAGPDGGPS